MKSVIYGVGGFDPTKPNNNIIEEIELPNPPHRPLSQIGALATLLAVTEVLSVEDAANAVSLKPDDLVAEAVAWFVASNGGVS